MQPPERSAHPRNLKYYCSKEEQVRMGSLVLLFEAGIKKGGMEDYLQLAASLKKEVSRAEGFIRSERFSFMTEEGKLLSLSVWKDEECVVQWRNQILHRLCQRQGRSNAFADYTVAVLAPIRCYGMRVRRATPEGSNQFLGA